MKDFTQYLNLLKSTSIFAGAGEEEIVSILQCMDATQSSVAKNAYILQAGDTISAMGLLLEGSALIVQEDIWGRRNVMAKLTAGDTFAESFAAARGESLNISVVADKDCKILWLDVSRILRTCPCGCEHHNLIIRNLVAALADKLLHFNEKITHMSRRTTRDKLLSFLSAESMRKGSLTFTIPYDRQQLADYLCVERSAMCAELSKLQKEGLIRYEKNRFTISS